MSKYKCNSCGGTYSGVTPDGGAYFHVCADGTRNENVRLDLIEEDGKLYKETGSTQDEAGPQRVEVASRLIAEGKGRTLVNP